MARERLSKTALYVERGYGQVEPNHLSAQRTGQIYAQLPAKEDIDVLENGQFVKYDYAKGVVDFEGPGEWMLVYNEVKLYRDDLDYNDFAMKKGDYAAKIYSPINGDTVANAVKARDYTGSVTAADPYVPDSTGTPFIIQQFKGPKMMPDNTTMVPRVFKTNVGDIFTTNCIKENDGLNVEDTLYVGDDGYLTKTAGEHAGDMKWQIVKLYTLSDRQKAAKLMRIA